VKSIEINQSEKDIPAVLGALASNSDGTRALDILDAMLRERRAACNAVDSSPHRRD
jgi:hypothetical protein